MDCFVAEFIIGPAEGRTRWLLAMTSKRESTTSRRIAPELCMNLSPNRGRGECRVPAAPAASCALCIGGKHTSNNEYTGIARHSRTQWFYGLCRALPGDRALLPPSPAETWFVRARQGPTCHPAKLDASVGASGPHDFAVRCNISRPLAVDRSQVFQLALPSRRAQNAAASTAPLPASVTIMIRPSCGVGCEKF